MATIDRLAAERSAGSALKGEFGGLRRLRVGRYRIIYETIHEELTVLVVRVAVESSTQCPREPSMSEIRMRQICLVAHDLDRIQRFAAQKVGSS